MRFPRLRFKHTVPVGAVLLVCFGLVAAAVVWAADSNGVWGTVSGGGTVAAQSQTLRVSGTIGQIAAGHAQSPQQRLTSGFWSGASCDCRFHGDIDADGDVDVLDVVLVVNTAFRGFPAPPADPLCTHVSRADVTCDEVINVLDVVIEVSTAFRGDDRRCDPCASR